MLVDKLRVDFKAGNGGDGLVSFARFGRSLGKNGKLYYPKKGKPDGGEGGEGGDIYLEGSSDIYDLADFTKKREYIAQNGNNGLPNSKKGTSGKDLVIKVPLITIITDINGKTLVKISKHGERKLLLKGGEGGKGNYFFREGQIDTLNKYTKGEEGKELKGFIELRLDADIVFIGFPNAGKSSMLNSLTNANVKVASYPFTTLFPQLGVMKNHIKLMDLPGLIEGVAEGKGLGKSFNKHTISSKLVAHFISLESEDPEKDYLSIRNELAEFSTQLLEKPEIIILNKADMFGEEEILKKIRIMEKFGKPVISTSSYFPEKVKEVEDKFIQLIRS